MSATEKAMNKVPIRCRKTIETYGFMVHYSKQNENERSRIEFGHKLRAYLHCLVDIGTVTLFEARLIQGWLIEGHVFPENEEGDSNDGKEENKV